MYFGSICVGFWGVRGLDLKAGRDNRYKVEAPGDPATHAQMEEWRRLLVQFLECEEAQETAEAKPKAPARLQRIATFDLACLTNRQLTVMLGVGWESVDDDVGNNLPLNLRPRGTLVWDMGPDNLCLTGWLLNCRRSRISAFFSLAHLCQRCLING